MANNPHDAGPPNEPPVAPPDRADAGAPGPADPIDWEAVARHLASEGTPAEQVAMRRWLAEHPAEAATVASLDRALDDLVLDRAPAADVDVEAALRRVQARRDADQPAEAADASTDRVLPMRPSRRLAPVRPATRWRASALRAAAVIAVLAGGTALWQQARDTGDAASGARSYATSVGERDSLRLPDGSRVVLGPGSSLEVAAGYGGTSRVVRLRGEAYFVVQHDAARPFVVHAGDASVEDLGTAFVVRSGAAGRVVVAVTEGSVRLQRARAGDAPANAGAGIVLRAGDRGALAAAGPATAERGAAGAADLAWTEGRLVFDDATAGDVAAALRRWYGIELRFADAALADRHLTASFRDEPVDDVLRVIALALGARLERQGDTVVVRPAPAGSVSP